MLIGSEEVVVVAVVVVNEVTSVVRAAVATLYNFCITPIDYSNNHQQLIMTNLPSYVADGFTFSKIFAAEQTLVADMCCFSHSSKVPIRALLI